MSRIFLTGATGFIGTALVRALAARGDECIVLSRSARNPWPGQSVRMVQGDPATAGRWEKELDGCDAVINLAGERIVSPLQRWTDDRKRLLRSSRIETTRNVVAGIRLARRPPQALLSSSAIGYYGGRGDEVLDEQCPPGDDFLAQLCKDWEAAALDASDRSRVTLLRSGVVLGKGGGGLSPLMTVFKFGIGGPWGDGRQWWSWIHLDDEIALILFALDRALSGPLNLTAPTPVTVDQFASAMGTALGRPSLLRVPEFAMRMALGEAADALLRLQRVVPRRALDAGFRFRFPTIEEALRDTFEKPGPPIPG